VDCASARAFDLRESISRGSNLTIELPHNLGSSGVKALMAA
jgi:hypothetical protein